MSDHSVRLRPVEADDIAPLRRLRNDIETQSILLGHPEARTQDDTAGWIERRRDDPNGLFRVVEVDGQCLGFVQLTGWHGLDRHAGFGIALLPECRGKGVGRSAMSALFEEARQLDLRKLLCEVRADNANAIALYRSLGFDIVGTYRDHYDDGARTWDVVVMEARTDAAAR